MCARPRRCSRGNCCEHRRESDGEARAHGRSSVAGAHRARVGRDAAGAPAHRRALARRYHSAHGTAASACHTHADNPHRSGTAARARSNAAGRRRTTDGGRVPANQASAARGRVRKRRRPSAPGQPADGRQLDARRGQDLHESESRAQYRAGARLHRAPGQRGRREAAHQSRASKWLCYVLLLDYEYVLLLRGPARLRRPRVSFAREQHLAGSTVSLSGTSCARCVPM